MDKVMLAVGVAISVCFLFENFTFCSNEANCFAFPEIHKFCTSTEKTFRRLGDWATGVARRGVSRRGEYEDRNNL